MKKNYLFFYGAMSLLGFIYSLWNWGYLVIMACPFLILFGLEYQAYKFNQK